MNIISKLKNELFQILKLKRKMNLYGLILHLKKINI
jgi:hypothetical protein